MVIVGEWLRCDDGVIRPAVKGNVFSADGSPRNEHFLVDSCADCTVLSALLLNKLHLPTQAPPPQLNLKGVSGVTSFVVVGASLEFIRDDGGPATVRGTFAAFTDPQATDLSVLGRDVLNHFDVILSHRNNAVFLLSGPHQYVVTRIG